MKTSNHPVSLVKGLNKILEIIHSTENQAFKADLLVNYRSYCSRLEKCIDCKEDGIIFKILLSERPMTAEEVKLISDKIAPHLEENIGLN